MEDILVTNEFEKLVSMGEDKLNHHIINGHLANPMVMRGIGLKFDAELALYGGISLEETADTIIHLLVAMKTGTFSNTPTYKLMKRLCATDVLAIPHTASSGLIQHQLNSLFSYEEHLRAEHQRLVNLGVAGGEAGELGIRPKRDDSFFKEFGLEPVGAR